MVAYGFRSLSHPYQERKLCIFEEGIMFSYTSEFILEITVEITILLQHYSVF